MLRLSAPGKELLAQSDIFEKNAGGSELNVVSGVTMLGGKGAIITKIPESKAGSYICSKIRMGNVDDKYVIFDSEPDKRLGIYYYENGAYPRKASEARSFRALCARYEAPHRLSYWHSFR